MKKNESKVITLNYNKYDVVFGMYDWEIGV